MGAASFEAGNKVVLLFDSTKSRGALLASYHSTLDTQLQIIFNVIYTPAKYPSFTTQTKLDFDEIVNDKFQVYAKQKVSGTTNLTPEQVQADADLLVQSIQPPVNSWLKGQGATNIKWHIHNSTGSYDVIVP